MSDLNNLIASAERELRQARKSSADGLYAILCALAVIKMKRAEMRGEYPAWRKSI